MIKSVVIDTKRQRQLTMKPFKTRRKKMERVGINKPITALIVLVFFGFFYAVMYKMTDPEDL